jgi:hypothetical protein
MFFMYPDTSLYPIFWSITTVSVIAGVLAIVGGTNTIRRRNWGWALTGSIAILSPSFPVMTLAVVEDGIIYPIDALFRSPLLLATLAIVWVVRCKKEFQ